MAEGDYYAKKFLEVLREHSQNKQDPVSEWELTDDVTPEASSNCICTKDIKVLYYIKNILSGEILIIGSDCAERWLSPGLECKWCMCSLGNVMQRRREKKFYCRACSSKMTKLGEKSIDYRGKVYKLKEVIKDEKLVEEILNNTKTYYYYDVFKFYISQFYTITEEEVD